MKSSSLRKQAARKLTNLKGGTTMKGRVKLVAVGVLLAVMLASGVVMAAGSPPSDRFRAMGMGPVGGITGSNQYAIGSTASFVWWNDTSKDVQLTQYYVTGPAPSSNTVWGPMPISGVTIPDGSSYSPLDVPISLPNFVAGNQYTIHVKGRKNFGTWWRDYLDSFTFEVVAAGSHPSPSPSPSPGGHSISFNPFLLFLLMSQAANSHHNDTPATPASPTPPAVQATGSIKATLTLNDAVTDGVLIAYKDGTELMDILQGTAAAGSAYTAQTELSPLGAVTGVAKLELPTGKWNVLAMKACEDGQFWISEMKEITVFQYFTIPVKLPLVGKIQPEA